MDVVGGLLHAALQILILIELLSVIGHGLAMLTLEESDLILLMLDRRIGDVVYAAVMLDGFQPDVVRVVHLHDAAFHYQSI